MSDWEYFKDKYGAVDAVKFQFSEHLANPQVALHLAMIEMHIRELDRLMEALLRTPEDDE